MGVKQSYLEKDYYVKNLYLKNSVLTLPLDVIEEIKNKELKESFDYQNKDIDKFLSNINMENVYQELFDEGAKAFKDAFNNMLKGLK